MRGRSETELTALLERVDRSTADLITYSIPVRARSGKGSVALPPIGRRIAVELARRQRPPRRDLVRESLPAAGHAPRPRPTWLPGAPTRSACVLQRGRSAGRFRLVDDCRSVYLGLYQRGQGIEVRLR
jgi:hypothetical protein